MPRLTAFFVLMTALAVTGCNSGELKFAPACPQLSLLAEGADLVRFAGAGRDVTDRVAEARISGVEASCSGRRGGQVVARVKVQAIIARGPAAQGRAVQVPYFVAVMDGETVLDRRAFVLAANFQPNVNTLGVTGDELELRFRDAGDSGAARYRIIVSLQLTEEELAYNRRVTQR